MESKVSLEAGKGPFWMDLSDILLLNAMTWVSCYVSSGFF